MEGHRIKAMKSFSMVEVLQRRISPDECWFGVHILPHSNVQYVCYIKLKCSDLFYIFMGTTYQLWYPFSRWYLTQQQKYSILSKFDTLFWMRLVSVLCNSYALTQTEVYKSLLYSYWDDISTPTLVMAFVVCIPLRYLIANKSPDA